MYDFGSTTAWSTILLVGVLLTSLLLGNLLKKEISFLNNSLIPTSVIGGLILIIVAAIYKGITGEVMFDTEIFAGKGTDTLEVITYHSLALGFIASTLKKTGKKLTKKRSVDIFNTGVTTVSTYLIQGIVGLGITIIAALSVSGFFKASGLLLPFGYGQGTGQAMNYGNIYEVEHGFAGGKTFALAIAALGFISASVGGVIHLNVMKRRGKINPKKAEKIDNLPIESKNEIPMQEGVDKMTVQIALIGLTYSLTYGFMYLLGELLPGMKSTIYAFNFLLGVLMSLVVKGFIILFKKARTLKKDYTNNFLLTRASNFFFDIMIISGIAAIRLDMLGDSLGILLIICIAGLLVTYAYNMLVAKLLFPEYYQEQFMIMFGMLTGTASSGIILLREIDSNFETPAAENLVYQNLPAIIFGFPLMILASYAPTNPELVLLILVAFFLVMNLILFRSFIFKKRKTKNKNENE